MPSSTHASDQSCISCFSGEQLQDFATNIHVDHFCQSLGTCRLRMQSTGPWGAHINLLCGVDDVKQVPLCQVTMETELSHAQPIFSVEYLSFSSFRSRDLLSGDKLRLCTSTQPHISFSEIRKLVWKQPLLCRQLRHCRMRGRCAAL